MQKQKQAFGAAPSGALDAEAVEAEVLAWMRAPPRRTTDATVEVLLKDVRKVLRGADEDLEALASSPVGAREFVWLGLLGEALVLLVDAELQHASMAKQIARELVVVVNDVRCHRTELAREGKAAGLAGPLLRAEGGVEDARRLCDDVRHVARFARRHLGAFPSASFARERIDALEESNAVLLRLVEEKQDLAQAESDLAARRNALRALTHEALVHIARWGVSRVGDAPDAMNRYRLDHLKKKKPRAKKEAPAAPG